MINILTIDLEEWFHFLEYECVESPEKWDHFESRIEASCDIILGILESENRKATFFILGWLAEKYPHIVKKIDDLGHHIGSHSHYHQLVHQLSRKQFDEDLKKSCEVISNITNKKVDCFRAPGFSITDQTLWALEVLIEHGIVYDASMFTANRFHGGIRGFQLNAPTIIEISGKDLKQFPMSYLSFGEYKIIFSGGGYLRLCPKFFVKKFAKRLPYNMTYVHPRDFDFHQPRFNDFSYLRYFRAYVGLRSTSSKFRQLCELDGLSIKQCDNIIDWSKAPRIKIA